MKILYHRILASLRSLLPAALIAAGALCAPFAQALPTDTYTSSSKLSAGYWVKISVGESGMHLLTEQQLRAWGFVDPSRVKVYGYGAQRLPERLDNTYIDDLPQTASEYLPGMGVVFYGEGPLSVVNPSSQYFRPAWNPFTMQGFYFLSMEGDAERLVPAVSQLSSPTASTPATTVRHFAVHELEAETPGHVGHMLVGEDFKYTRSQSFVLDLPGIDVSEPVRMETSFVSYTVGQPATLSFTANGTSLKETSGDRILATSDSYSHGREGISQKEFKVGTPSVTIGVNYATAGSVVTARLNYISITYRRALSVDGGQVPVFYADGGANGFSLAGADASTRVWDITSLTDISAMNLSSPDAQGRAQWSLQRNGQRRYVAWKPTSTFLTATFVEAVRNQNLHALGEAEMVIFTPNQWRTQAERLAQIHRDDQADPLSVLVLTPKEIYNEFASGSPDAQAFRKLLKMLYDRQSGTEHPLRYALFMSRPTYDNRRLTTEGQQLSYPTLPAWFTDRGLHDNEAYTTDDIFGFLADNSGQNTASDKLDIAVGRIPCTSAEAAKSAVDKIIRYRTKMPMTGWRNAFVITADDEDGGDHMEQSELFCHFLMEGDGADQVLVKKVYIDEYPLISNVTEEGRKTFYRYLDEGTLWWNFVGHASSTSLTAESFVTYTDINNMYLRHWPVVYAATCNFLKWDHPSISGAEILFSNPNGGVIAAISANRPVYIPNNGNLTASFGRHALERDASGRFNTIGEVYRRAKNDYRYVSDPSRDPLGTPSADSNKLRYVLMGDPAMRMLIPSLQVVLDKIGDTDLPADPDKEPPTLMARQQTTVSGHVADADGALLADFNGVVLATMYDAQSSVTTRGNGDDGKPYTFDHMQGGRLFVGNARVTDGKFTLEVNMPSEVADNYLPAALNFFAYEESGAQRQATGVNREFYVYGIDTDAEPDNTPPTINAFYLNHPTFENGGEVNNSPVIIAEFTDDRAINLSTAGIGHQISLSLDGGNKSFADVADYLTPYTDGRIGGRIMYPLNNLAVGAHSVRLRVWDTGLNCAEQTLDFFVAKEAVPTIYNVYTDTNPASVEANFYVSHDRPDRDVTVTIEVFDMMGRRLWQATRSGRSDMFESLPITWDLTDYGGHRVPRGIYLYRATISDDYSGEKTSTASRRLAVTAE